MADHEPTKVCPMCAETIRLAAKLCPHCRQWQKTWYNPFIWIWLHLGVTFAMLIGFLMLLDNMLGEGRDFAPYRHQIKVSSSTMNMSQTEKGRYISAVGILTNRSEFAWKEVQLEAQYFDKDGKLIDTGLERNYSATVLAHTEAAFRIRTLADRPESSYVSHKVLIRAAQDARKHF